MTRENSYRSFVHSQEVTRLNKAVDDINHGQRSDFTSWGNPIGEIISNLNLLRSDQLYQQSFGEQALAIGHKYGYLYAERFTKALWRLTKIPGFDFDIYTALFNESFQKFGRLTGSYFIWSYPDIVKRGIDPQAYFQDVNQAVAQGGKKFGGWYAYYLPPVLQAHGKPELLQDEAIGILRLAGLPMAKHFMAQAPKMFDADIPFPHFAIWAKACIEQFDTDNKKKNGHQTTSYWFIHNMADLHKFFGYYPQEFLSDLCMFCQDNQKGKIAAKWYAYGLTGIIEQYIRLKSMTVPQLHHHPWQEDVEDEAVANQRIAQAHHELTMLSHVDFRELYKLVLREMGQGSATFFALVSRLNPDELLLIPDELYNLRRYVSKKVFSAALWNIPTIVKESRGTTVATWLMDVVECFNHMGEEAILKALSYTKGVSLRSGYPTKLWFPKEIIRYDQPTNELMDYQDEDY